MRITPPGRKSTVLIVTDNRDSHQYIAQSLSDEYHVIAAFDQQQGLDMALRESPALVIADAELPGMNGIDMIADLRKQAALLDLPILLLLAQDDEEQKIKSLEDPAQGYVTKPFSVNDLRACVRNMLRLKTSQERYATLFKSMDQGFCTIEVLFDQQNTPIDYRFLEINAAFERQTSLNDARGKLMRDLAPNHEQYWFDIYGKIALTGESARFENLAEALGRWYEVYAFRIGRAENRQVAIFFNDISERKRAEEATRESAQRLQLALSASQLGDWHWEAATDKVTLSPRASEIFGLGARSTHISWAAMHELLHPEDREMAHLAVERAISTGSDYNIEYRVVRPSGLAWVSARGRGDYTEQGIVGMTGVVQDVTVHRQTEEALRQSEERFRASFNQAAVGMAIAELDGRFEQVNERFTEILGYTFGLHRRRALSAYLSRPHLSQRYAGHGSAIAAPAGR